ncbi:ATP-binding domain-containing protein [Myxococcus xanthus]|uniref:DNA 3'-5' helicase II n=1 Tax=Myxococcus xanthus TaxID=34 RepID=A0A7Y4IKD2_MYXXA|nr:ATP-binding domain-containing protein [Myxococcus xanthus]NOJ80769.1 ATP-binding domain-containing protein [Myxococcus xanthus]NOJ84521.1 ATP-binding domain-containing protein [Myxococcus xanthus]
MAQMFPSLTDLELKELAKKSSAEIDVYRAFRDQTPAEWLVLHGLSLISRTPGAPPRDAEADFVVFEPKRGFVVVEVKGGGVSRDARGRWSSTGRNGTYKIKDPVQQAKANKHQVLDSLKSAKTWGPSGAPMLLMGHAALFPDTFTTSSFVAPDRPQEILGAGSDVKRLQAWVDGVFRYWATNNASWKPLGQLGMGVVRAVFCSQVTVQASLSLAIEREQRRQVELTQRQALTLQNLRYRRRAAIAGAAGTGKTLIALQHARAIAAQGRRTLLVCYSRALADFLGREAGGVANLEVMDFHQLCDRRVKHVKRTKGIDLLAMAKEKLPMGDEYNVQLPYALALSTEHDPQRYQAILVDEGQDFGDEYWLPVELLLASQEDTQLYVFYDPNQAIYKLAKDLSNLGLGPPLLLTENCRNTRPVHEAAYRYYQGDDVAPPEVEGEPITQLSADGLKAQAKCIQTIVSNLLQQGGLKPDEIVVLVAGERKDGHFRALHDCGDPGGACWSFEVLWRPGCVLVDTARRFKGLEATAVILWCAEEVDATIERELLYVAFTRARNRLWVVGTAARIAKVLRGG